MLIALIIVILLIQFIRRQQQTQPKKSFLRNNRLVIALMLITIVPIIAFNFFLPNTYIQTKEDLVEYGIDHENFLLIREAYDLKIAQDPKNVKLRFEYIELAKKYSSNDCDAAVYALDFVDSTTEIFTRDYQELTCNEHLNDSDFQSLLKMNEQPFKNYLLGFASYYNNDNRCELFLKNEIKLQPNYTPSYNLLAHYYYKKSETKKLETFISNPKNRAKIDVDFRAYYQFSKGHLVEYAHTIIETRVKTVKLIAVFPALIISLIWLFYLWKIDVFNPEKWYHIFFVFCLGTFFTFLCLPLYDIAHYIFNFNIKGTLLNDFLFSFLVIGGSEELVKFLPWFLFALISKRLKEPYDYILYACVAALGFAFAENWMYLENANNITLRALVSTVGHMFDASIIAYAYILYRFKYKAKKWRIILPMAGFILAALSHGFYDFWLISPAVQDLSFVTMIFFVITLYIWFLFKNNAINHSSFYTPRIQLNALFLQDFITIAVVGIFMMEYLFVSSEFGARFGNQGLRHDVAMVGLFIIYFNYQIQQLKVEPGIWQRIRFKLPSISNYIPFLKRSAQIEEEDNPDELLGKMFTYYTSKSNKYIGNQLPASGKITHTLIIEGAVWYAVELSKPINYSNFVPNFVVVRTFKSHQSLMKDKVEVLLLLVPTIEIFNRGQLKMSDFRYTGKVYSRPKH